MRAGQGLGLHLGMQASSGWICPGSEPAQRVNSRSEHPQMRAGQGLGLHLGLQASSRLICIAGHDVTLHLGMQAPHA